LPEASSFAIILAEDFYCIEYPLFLVHHHFFMIKDPKLFISAINQVCAEKNLSKEVVMESVKAALRTAYKKDFGKKDQNIMVDINEDTGMISLHLVKTVVKKVENDAQEISLAEAKKYKKGSKLGDEILIEVTPPEEYGRIAAQSAKQVIMQRIQEAERDMLFETFKERENELVTALVSKVDGNQVFLEIERNLVPLPPEERVNGERYFPGTRMKVFLNKVVKTTKGPLLLISRRHPDLVKKLFEVEIPEIRNGIVEIKKVARSAGIRSKVAVISKDDKIDPIGACVGQKGVRIQNVIRELNGEMIDVIEWSDDVEKCIQAALAPAKISAMSLLPNEKRAVVYVTNDQRPLAIGKQGQNVKLASELCGLELDIRDISEQTASKEPPTEKPLSIEEQEHIADIQIPTEKDDLELLELPEGTLKKLKKAGIDKISYLQKMNEEDLTQIGGIGKETANKILDAIKKYKTALEP
jgi:N utilization substance protein A